MTERQERIDLLQEYNGLQVELGTIVLRLAELDEDRASQEAQLMTEATNALEQIRASLASIAVLLDSISANPAISAQESIGALDVAQLNEDTVSVLAQLFSPEDVQLVAQLEGAQKRAFIEQLHKLWVRYSGPRGKSSTIQTDRIESMYVCGLTIRKVADMEACFPSAITNGLNRLVMVLSRASIEERKGCIVQAQKADSTHGDITAIVAVAAPNTAERVVKDPSNLDMPPLQTTALPMRVQAKERDASATANAPLQLKEWVTNRDMAIAKALKGRYGKGDASMHQAIDTLLSPVRTSFTPNQREVIGNILREIGIDSDPLDVQARAMLDLPDKLRGFGFSNEYIKYFAMFVGLSASVHQDTVTILGVTKPRPIGQIMDESRNGANLRLLDVQVVLTQAMVHFLRGTEPVRRDADGILKT